MLETGEELLVGASEGIFSMKAQESPEVYQGEEQVPQLFGPLTDQGPRWPPPALSFFFTHLFQNPSNIRPVKASLAGRPLGKAMGLQ